MGASISFCRRCVYVRIHKNTKQTIEKSIDQIKERNQKQAFLACGIAGVIVSPLMLPEMWGAFCQHTAWDAFRIILGIVLSWPAASLLIGTPIFFIIGWLRQRNDRQIASQKIQS
jgi:hypothetical protein